MKKRWLAAAILLSSICLGLVYAQENGYLINISNSNANINTVISNSTVIENITLSNGTLNLQINADNISSVIINGVNYTAQQSPNPAVIITYCGENVVPSELTGFPNPWIITLTKQPAPDYFYSWNLTLVNIIPLNSPFNIFPRLLQPLTSKYPQLVTMETYVQGVAGNVTTLFVDATGFGGNPAKSCFVLYSNSQLSNDEIDSLTQNLITQLSPALIEWYS